MHFRAALYDVFYLKLHFCIRRERNIISPREIYWTTLTALLPRDNLRSAPFDFERIRNKCQKLNGSTIEIIVLHHDAILRYHSRNESWLFVSIFRSYALNDRPVSPSTIIYRLPVKKWRKCLLARQKVVFRFLVRIVVKLDGPFKRCDKSPLIPEKSRIDGDCNEHLFFCFPIFCHGISHYPTSNSPIVQ